MMRSAKKKKQKVDKELLLRKEALEQLKAKIETTKKAIKVSETAKKVEEVKNSMKILQKYHFNYLIFLFVLIFLLVSTSVKVAN